MEDRRLSAEEVLKIPQELLPLMVLSDDLYGLFALTIRQHQQGCYNHFMWMHWPGFFASQGLFFEEVPAQKYLQGRHRLKFWHCPGWTPQERGTIIDAIAKDLAKPKLKTRYDWLQILGIAVGLRYLNLPGLRICSDYIEYLRLVDKGYDLKPHPSPPEVNCWLEEHEHYQVYGRFYVD